MKELADLETPAKVQRRLLEKDVQKQCVDWARARGYWARKFSSMTSAAEPDYIFAQEIASDRHDYPNGELETDKIKFATEFKAPGKTSTQLQLDEQEEMRRAGWHVFECDDFEKFKAEVIRYEQEIFR